MRPARSDERTEPLNALGREIIEINRANGWNVIAPSDWPVSDGVGAIYVADLIIELRAEVINDCARAEGFERGWRDADWEVQRLDVERWVERFGERLAEAMRHYTTYAPAPQEGAVPSRGEMEVERVIDAIVGEALACDFINLTNKSLRYLRDILRKHLSHPKASPGESER